MNRALRSIGVVLLGAALAGRAGSAAADDGLDVRVVSVDDSQFPAVTLVLAVEAADRPVSSLQASDIAFTDNGTPGSVTSVRRIQDASIPTTVVVALDTSGSMAGANLIRAKEALSSLVSGLSSTDKVGLVSFSDRPTVVAAPGSASAVGQAVTGLQAAGNTALYGAVAESARVAASAGDARRLVILLTDGEEYGNVSGLTREASLAQAAQSGAIFYVIGLGVGADREYLNELADRTGGRYLDAPTTADLDSGYAAIEETLRGQFVVGLKSDAPASPLSRSMTVSVTHAGATKTAEFAFTSSRQLPEPTIEPTAAPPVAPIPTTTEEPTESEKSGSPVWIGITLVALVIAGAGLWWWRRRAREPAIPLEPVNGGELPLHPVAAEREPVASVARLVRRPQPGGGSPETFQIGYSPASIGWSQDCQVQLPRADGLSAVHARLWWRDGSLMLHDLSGGGTNVNGAPARWASLADSDRLDFGPFSFEVFVTEPVAAGSPD